MAEYLALGEIEPGYTELFEGRVLLTPTPDLRHASALMQLWSQLHEQLPADLEAIGACRLVGDAYVDEGAATGTFRTSAPFPVEIDLA